MDQQVSKMNTEKLFNACFLSTQLLVCDFDDMSLRMDYITKKTMPLLFSHNHSCHHTILIAWCFLTFWCWLSPTCAPLACLTLKVFQNNANPLICAVSGILFLPVPTWHCSPVCGAYVSLSVPSSTAQHPRGMVLICGTQKQCVCKNTVFCWLLYDLLFSAS